MADEAVPGKTPQDQLLDQSILNDLTSGDPTALEHLYDRYATVALSVILRIVTDRQIAEELLQELFLRIWQQAAVYDPDRGSVRPWILGIAHNLGLNELRTRRRRPQAATPASGMEAQSSGDRFSGMADPGPAPQDIAWEHERRRTLARALHQLPPVQRSVIELYAHGYSQSEIARHLSEPLGTVKTRMRRGLHQLRGIVESMGLDGEGQ